MCKYPKYPNFALELLTYMSWFIFFFLVFFYCSISRRGSSGINQNATYSRTDLFRDSFYIHISSQII